MKLRTLGTLALEGTAFGREKPLLLLCYLALEGPQARRFVAELFWPEAAKPLTSLSVALSQLRKVVPEALETDGSHEVSADDLTLAHELRPSAELGITHRRAPRVNEVSLAPTGRARCRSCRELIEKDTWRIGLVFFEEYRFQPSGFIHLGCAEEYFGTNEIMDRVRHFNPKLIPEELEAIAAGLGV